MTRAPFRVPRNHGELVRRAMSRLETGWSNSDVGTFRAKATPESPDYKPQVAEPVMNAIDAMPPAFRPLVHEFGYVDVYNAWKRGWSVAAIRATAREGCFRLPGLY